MRLWDKGTPLDDRVLAFTAGEDHALDERLVRYDVLASIAHARMLAGRGLITPEDFKAIEKGLLKSAPHMRTASGRSRWPMKMARRRWRST